MAHGINKQVIQKTTSGGGGSVNSGTFTCDFGTNTSQLYQKDITVSDANCTTTSKPVVTLYNADTRDSDEIEYVQLKPSIKQINNGNFVVTISDDAMQAEGIYTFNYILI